MSQEKQAKKPSRQERRRLEKEQQQEKKLETNLLSALEKIDNKIKILDERLKSSIPISYMAIKEYLTAFNQTNLSLIQRNNIKKKLVNVANVISERLQIDLEYYISSITLDDFEEVISNSENGLKTISKEEMIMIKYIFGNETIDQIQSHSVLIKKIRDINIFIEAGDKEKILTSVESVVNFDFGLWKFNTSALLSCIQHILVVIKKAGIQKDFSHQHTMRKYYTDFCEKFESYCKHTHTISDDNDESVILMLTFIILLKREHYQTLSDVIKNILKNKIAKISTEFPSARNIYYHFYLAALEHLYRFEGYSLEEKSAAIQALYTHMSKNIDVLRNASLDITTSIIRLSLPFLLKEFSEKLKISVSNCSLLDAQALLECLKIVFASSAQDSIITSIEFFKALAENFSRNPSIIQCTRGNIDIFLKWFLKFHQEIKIDHKDPNFIRSTELIFEQLKKSILKILNTESETFSKDLMDCIALLSEIQKDIIDIRSICGDEFADKLTEQYNLVQKFEPVCRFIVLQLDEKNTEEEILKLLMLIKDIALAKEYKSTHLIYYSYKKYQEILTSKKIYSANFLAQLEFCYQIFKDSLQCCYTETPISLVQAWIVAFHTAISGHEYYKSCSLEQKTELKKGVVDVVARYMTELNYFLFFNFFALDYFLDKNPVNNKNIFSTFNTIKKNKDIESLKYLIPERIIALLKILEKENKISADQYSSLPPLDRLEAILVHYLTDLKSPNLISNTSEKDQPRPIENEPVLIAADINSIKNNLKIIQRKFHSVNAALGRRSILTYKFTEDLNKLILIFKDPINKLLRKKKEAQDNEIFSNIFELMQDCTECLKLQQKSLTQDSQTVIEKLKSILTNESPVRLFEKEKEKEITHENTKKTVIKKKLNVQEANHLIAQLREVARKTYEGYDKNEAEQLIFYKLIQEYLKLCGDHIEELKAKHEFNKIFGLWEHKLVNSLEKEIKFVFTAVLYAVGKRANALRDAEIILNNISSQEDKVQAIFGQEVAGKIKLHQHMIVNLQKVEKFLELKLDADLEVALTLVDSMHEIAPSAFEYNANIIYAYYQRISFFLAIAKESKNNDVFEKLSSAYQKFQQQLEICCQNLTLEQNTEERALLMLFYIVVINQKSYEFCSQETKETLQVIIEDVKEKSPTIFYYYLDFYMAILDFLDKYDQYHQHKKHEQSKIIFNKINQTKELAKTKNSSLLDYLILDTLPYLIDRLSAKMRCSATSVSKNQSPEEMLTTLEEMLNNIRPFPKESNNPSLGTAAAVIFANSNTVQQTVLNHQNINQNNSQIEPTDVAFTTNTNQ